MNWSYNRIVCYPIYLKLRKSPDSSGTYSRAFQFRLVQFLRTVAPSTCDGLDHFRVESLLPVMVSVACSQVLFHVLCLYSVSELRLVCLIHPLSYNSALYWANSVSYLFCFALSEPISFNPFFPFPSFSSQGLSFFFLFFKKRECMGLFLVFQFFTVYFGRYLAKYFGSQCRSTASRDHTSKSNPCCIFPCFFLYTRGSAQSSSNGLEYTKSCLCTRLEKARNCFRVYSWHFVARCRIERYRPSIESSRYDSRETMKVIYFV